MLSPPPPQSPTDTLPALRPLLSWETPPSLLRFPITNRPPYSWLLGLPFPSPEKRKNRKYPRRPPSNSRSIRNFLFGAWWLKFASELSGSAKICIRIRSHITATAVHSAQDWSLRGPLRVQKPEFLLATYTDCHELREGARGSVKRSASHAERRRHLLNKVGGGVLKLLA